MSSEDSASGEDPDTETGSAPDGEVDDVEEVADEPIDLTNVDPDEIDPEDLEDQEWTLGGDSRGTIEFGGMTWLVQDPEDDEILNLIVGAAAGEGEAADMSGSDRMYSLCESAVIAPEITPDRWREMKSGERIGLTMRISEWAGIDQLMNEDFGDGQSPQSGN